MAGILWPDLVLGPVAGSTASVLLCDCSENARDASASDEDCRSDIVSACAGAAQPLRS